MENMNWNYPTPIWFGLNRVKEIQKACDNLLINNPLIVTDPGIQKTDIIDKINLSLNNKASVYSDVQGNPTGQTGRPRSPRRAVARSGPGHWKTGYDQSRRDYRAGSDRGFLP